MVKGKVAIITGSAGGIGRWIAKTFAQAGAKVVVCDVKPLDTVVSELKALETEHLAVPTDVTDPAAVEQLMRRTADAFGRIDVLVNNAAIVPHFQWGIEPWPRIRDLDPGFWDRVIRTNLGGTFLCTKLVLPYMEDQRAGHIVNLTGGTNHVGGSPYGVSKDAIRSFTRFVANEEREFGVCVVGMGPNPRCLTGIATEDAPEEARQRMRGVESIGNRFVLAAQAGMELSGKMLDVENGALVGF